MSRVGLGFMLELLEAGQTCSALSMGLQTRSPNSISSKDWLALGGGKAGKGGAGGGGPVFSIVLHISG